MERNGYKVTRVRRWVDGRMVGNRAGAIKAIEGDYPLIGEGALRRVYDGGSVVYKVAKPRLQRHPVVQRSEYERACRVAKTPTIEAYAPRTCLYYIQPQDRPEMRILVIAMEKVAQDVSELSSDEAMFLNEEIEDAMIRYANHCWRVRGKSDYDEIGDMHDWNYRRTKDGQLKFTDLGDVIWGLVW